MHAIVLQVEILAVGTNQSVYRNKRIWKEQYITVFYILVPFDLKIHHYYYYLF